VKIGPTPTKYVSLSFKTNCLITTTISITEVTPTADESWFIVPFDEGEKSRKSALDGRVDEGRHADKFNLTMIVA